MYIELQLIETSPNKPKMWLRFIDDILMIWNHGKQTLEEFKELANNIHPTIKFSFESNDNEIPFLDTVIYRGKDNHILTRLYHKPTDNKQYLHFNSAHPWRQKRSVPYGLLMRCKRICSEEAYFIKESKAIIQQLTIKKLPFKPATRSIRQGEENEQSPTIEKEPKKTHHTKIRLITHYNPSNPNFDQILQEHTGLLLMTRKEAIKPDDIEVTYSISPNLKDVLIKGNLNDTQTTKGTTPCGKTRCKTCNHIQSGSKVKKGQDTYDLRGNFTCQSRNIVYLLTCNICNKKYVGETEQTLNGRCRGHEVKYKS